MARDWTIPHPTVEMDGDHICFTCVHAISLGWCKLHSCDVSVFDGCAKHEVHLAFIKREDFNHG